MIRHWCICNSSSTVPTHILQKSGNSFPEFEIPLNYRSSLWVRHLGEKKSFSFHINMSGKIRNKINPSPSLLLARVKRGIKQTYHRKVVFCDHCNSTLLQYKTHNTLTSIFFLIILEVIFGWAL